MSDKGEALMPEVVELLKVMIRGQEETNAALKGLAGQVDALTGRVDGLTAEVQGIRSDLKAGLARQDQHEARLSRLEEAVFRPGPRGRTRAARR